MGVDYQVRLDKRLRGTPVRFVTHGIALRYLISSNLEEFEVVVLDEFHERQLDSDLLLARLLHLRKQRPALKLVVMSATLEVDPLERHLGVKALLSEGRSFPVAIEFRDLDPMAPLEQKLAQTFVPGSGHTLVFLPGMRELERCRQAVAYEPTHLLHGRLDSTEALAPSQRPKLILATNVAESSVTIEGVTAVIDSGLARVARSSPWSGVQSLGIERVSQASAIQRAGRAGRTGPGRCIRLYSQADYDNREAFDTPEIERADLASLLLHLQACGLEAGQLPWLTPPQPDRLEAARRCLALLGADNPAGAKRLAGWPLQIRLAHLLETAQDMGLGRKALRVVAGLEREPSSDPLHPRRWDKALEKQLNGRLENRKSRSPDLKQAVFLSFADRVARVHSDRVVPAFGPGMEKPEGLHLKSDFAVVVAAEERRRGRPRALSLVEVESEWLWETFLDQLQEEEGLAWDAKAQRVALKSRVRLGQIVLEENKSWAEPGEKTGIMLAQHLPDSLKKSDSVLSFLRRAHWVAQARPEFPAPPSAEAFWEGTCRWVSSLKEIDEQFMQGQLMGLYDYEQLQHLNRLAPVEMKLPGRRKPAKINYPPEGKPWIAGKIADFMGLASQPTLGGGKIPLLFHILAPNFRPVQVTDDLLGFWERTYPRVRKELRGRYPKHPWPVDPRVTG